MIMMKLVVCLVGLLSIMMVVARPQQQQQPQPQPQQHDDAQLVQQFDNLPFILADSMSEFGIKLYELQNENSRGNIVMSPFSLHTALSMVYLGSPPHSQTNLELTKLLSLQPRLLNIVIANYLRLMHSYRNVIAQNNVTVSLANKIFAANDLRIKDDYFKVLRTFYKTTLEQINMQDRTNAARIINDFAKKSTNNLIPQVIMEQDIDALTKMVLINAIYFKANWLFQFNKNLTRPMQFRVDQNREITVPQGMYLREHLRMARVQQLQADVLELPYVGDHFQMMIIVPNNGQDIRQLGRDLYRMPLSDLDAILSQEAQDDEVELYMPAFKMDYNVDNLVDDLKKLGVVSLFEEHLADLSDMSDTPLYVSTVVHKAAIEVNEEGSEAAAVTAVVLNTRSGSAKAIRQFHVDQPFLFYIYDKELQVPLFMGRVVDPTGKLQLLPEDPAKLSERIGLDAAAAAAAAADGSRCGELGYDVTNANSDSVSLPCKGQDTFQVRNHQTNTGRLQEARQRTTQTKRQ